MSLGSRDIVDGIKRQGLRREAFAVAVVIVFGIVDQFTAKVIPRAADTIQDHFFPPTFVIAFDRPIQGVGALKVNRVEASALQPVSLRQALPPT